MNKNVPDRIINSEVFEGLAVSEDIIISTYELGEICISIPEYINDPALLLELLNESLGEILAIRGELIEYKAEGLERSKIIDSITLLIRKVFGIKFVKINGSIFYEKVGKSELKTYSFKDAIDKLEKLFTVVAEKAPIGKDKIQILNTITISMRTIDDLERRFEANKKVNENI